MPRPNPPRKRPRRRPDSAQRAARADAELTKQTAQSAQGGAQRPESSRRPKAEVVTNADAPAPADEMWTRRSYFILVGLVAATEVFIGLLFFGLSPGAKDGLVLLEAVLGLQPWQPFPLLAACLLAAPVARRLTMEKRPLRTVETLVLGVVIYLIFNLLFSGVVLAVTGGGGSSGGGTACATAGAVATPVPSSASASSSPCPSPSASPSATPSATPRPSASTTASPSPNGTGTATNTPAINGFGAVALAGGLFIASYPLAALVYPPLYKRLRIRRPPPRSNAKR